MSSYDREKKLLQMIAKNANFFKGSWKKTVNFIRTSQKNTGNFSKTSQEKRKCSPKKRKFRQRIPQQINFFKESRKNVNSDGKSGKNSPDIPLKNRGKFKFRQKITTYQQKPNFVKWSLKKHRLCEEEREEFPALPSLL